MNLERQNYLDLNFVFLCNNLTKSREFIVWVNFTFPQNISRGSEGPESVKGNDEALTRLLYQKPQANIRIWNLSHVNHISAKFFSFLFVRKWSPDSFLAICLRLFKKPDFRGESPESLISRNWPKIESGNRVNSLSGYHFLPKNILTNSGHIHTHEVFCWRIT